MADTGTFAGKSEDTDEDEDDAADGDGDSCGVLGGDVEVDPAGVFWIFVAGLG